MSVPTTKPAESRPSRTRINVRDESIATDGVVLITNTGLLNIVFGFPYYFNNRTLIIREPEEN